MSTKAVPIILCGREEKVGRPVIEFLKPEYEVIHFTPTDDDGALNIPLLLSGKPAQHPASTIGSGNYTSPPVAIVLGGGYDEANIQKFRDALQGVSGARTVPWLRADKQKTRQQGAKPGTPPYPDQVAARVKEVLDRLDGEGKLDGSEGGDHWW